jgi:tRNA dimethylallyltransferase
MTYTLTPKPYPLLVLVGPTSSGKSELAILLAKKFNGEIISADSRQIYKGLNLGTGKVKGKWLVSLLSGRSRVTQKRNVYVYKKIAHHLIDFVSPKKQYSVSLFQEAAQKEISDIIQRGKLPILCGGTAHWVDAVVYDQKIPDVKPNLKLRASLEKKSVAELYKQLKKLDPVRAKSIDPKNPRRLIRALEISISTGHPVPPLTTDNSQLTTLWLGLNPSQKTLYKKIDLRLKQRLKQGMVKEVSRLHNQGLSWKRLESFGLEYKYIALFLQKKLTRKEMFTQLSFAIKHYSKRQMTWWKRNKDINWITKLGAALKLVEKFLA